MSNKEILEKIINKLNEERSGFSARAVQASESGNNEIVDFLYGKARGVEDSIKIVEEVFSNL